MRRSAFLVRVIGIGILLHIYIGFRLIPDLPVGSVGRALALLWLVLSCGLIPLGVLARALERQPLPDRLARLRPLPIGFFSRPLLATLRPRPLPAPLPSLHSPRAH